MATRPKPCGCRQQPALGSSTVGPTGVQSVKARRDEATTPFVVFAPPKLASESRPGPAPPITGAVGPWNPNVRTTRGSPLGLWGRPALTRSAANGDGGPPEGRTAYVQPAGLTPRRQKTLCRKPLILTGNPRVSARPRSIAGRAFGSGGRTHHVVDRRRRPTSFDAVGAEQGIVEAVAPIEPTSSGPDRCAATPTSVAGGRPGGPPCSARSPILQRLGVGPYNSQNDRCCRPPRRRNFDRIEQENVSTSRRVFFVHNQIGFVAVDHRHDRNHVRGNPLILTIHRGNVPLNLGLARCVRCRARISVGGNGWRVVETALSSRDAIRYLPDPVSAHPNRGSPRHQISRKSRGIETA